MLNFVFLSDKNYNFAVDCRLKLCRPVVYTGWRFSPKISDTFQPGRFIPEMATAS